MQHTVPDKLAMSTRSSQVFKMASQKLGEEFEDIELGSIKPAIVIQPLTDQLSQDGNQNEIGRRIVTEVEAAEYTAYAYRSSLKWKILVVLWMVSLVKTS